MLTFPKETDNNPNIGKRNLLILAGCWVGVCVLLSLLVRLPILFAGVIAEAFDPAIGQVLMAWQEANVSLPLWLLFPCGLILTACEAFLIHKSRNKTPVARIAWILAAVFSGLILLIGFVLLLLWNSKINNIPVSVVIRILADLAGSL